MAGIASNHGQVPGGLKEHYPMYLLPVKRLMDMNCFLPHQMLLEQGLLETWTPEFDGRVICVSHQWLGYAEPDPEGEHFTCLKRVLERLADGTAGHVEEYWLHKLYYPCGTAWSDNLTGSVLDMYVWIDYSCTPQIRMHCSNDTAIVARSAVKSIPAYFERCSLLLIVAPLCKHCDTGMACNYATWRSRGWCRLELLAATLSPRHPRAIICQGPEALLNMISPCDLSRLVPAEGCFSCCALGHQLHNKPLPCDRKRVGTVVESVMDATIEHRITWGRRIEAFYWASVKHAFLDGWGPKPMHAAGKWRRNQLRSQFTDDGDLIEDLKEKLDWQELDDKNSARTGFTLLMFAAFSKSAPLVRALTRAGYDPNVRLKQATKNLPPCVGKGFRPLMAAMIYGTPETVQALLDAKANPFVRTQGAQLSPLCFAIARGRADNVQHWLRSVKDWNLELTDKNGLTAACLASVLPIVRLEAKSKAPILRAILEAGARHDNADCWGGPGGCIAMAALNEDSDLGVLEVLIKHGHSVNSHWQSKGMFMSAQMALVRVMAGCSKRSRFKHDVAIMEGATPLHFAAKRGDISMVRFLVDMKADTQVRNAQGRTPLQVAAAANREGTVHHFLKDLLQPPLDKDASAPEQLRPPSSGITLTLGPTADALPA